MEDKREEEREDIVSGSSMFIDLDEPLMRDELDIRSAGLERDAVWMMYEQRRRDMMRSGLVSAGEEGVDRATTGQREGFVSGRGQNIEGGRRRGFVAPGRRTTISDIPQEIVSRGIMQHLSPISMTALTESHRMFTRSTADPVQDLLDRLRSTVGRIMRTYGVHDFSGRTYEVVNLGDLLKAFVRPLVVEAFKGSVYKERIYHESMQGYHMGCLIQKGSIRIMSEGLASTWVLLDAVMQTDPETGINAVKYRIDATPPNDLDEEDQGILLFGDISAGTGGYRIEALARVLEEVLNFVPA